MSATTTALQVDQVVTPDQFVNLCQSKPAVFFPDTDQQLDQARTLCRECPTELDCRTGARQRREPWGVWGGTLYFNGAQVDRIPVPRAAAIYGLSVPD